MGQIELIDIKFSLDQETIDFLTAAAKAHKISRSGFLRMVPTLLTPEERDMIMELRDLAERPESDRNTVGRVHATQE